MKKPDHTYFFNQMPFIGAYLKHDYAQANCLRDMINLCHKWLSEASLTNNIVRKAHFQASANFVYSIITNRAYENKDVQMYVDSI